MRRCAIADKKVQTNFWVLECRVARTPHSFTFDSSKRVWAEWAMLYGTKKGPNFFTVQAYGELAERILTGDLQFKKGDKVHCEGWLGIRKSTVRMKDAPGSRVISMILPFVRHLEVIERCSKVKEKRPKVAKKFL